MAVRSVRPGKADPTIDGMVAASGDHWVGNVAARAAEAELGSEGEALAVWLAVAQDVIAAETRRPIMWLRTEFAFGSVKVAGTVIRRTPWRAADDGTPPVGTTAGTDEAVLALAASLVPTEARWKRTGDGPDRLGSSWSRRGRVGGV